MNILNKFAFHFHKRVFAVTLLTNRTPLFEINLEKIATIPR